MHAPQEWDERQMDVSSREVGARCHEMDARCLEGYRVDVCSECLSGCVVCHTYMRHGSHKCQMRNDEQLRKMTSAM
eukprot:5015703-Pleurochrysis_carterae.AAC.2